MSLLLRTFWSIRPSSPSSCDDSVTFSPKASTSFFREMHLVKAVSDIRSAYSFDPVPFEINSSPDTVVDGSQ